MRVKLDTGKLADCIDRTHGGQVFGDMVDTLECMVIGVFGGGHAVYREVHNVRET